MTLRKGITWAYPTSDDAKRFNRYDTGVWTVDVNDESYGVLGEEYSHPFDTYEEAYKFFEDLNFEVSTFFHIEASKEDRERFKEEGR